MKNILRAVQTHFPFLHDVRFRFKFSTMSITKTVHEKDFKAMQLLDLQDGQLFLDIGSNRGEAILSLQLMNNKKMRIIGFEPNPFVYKKLSTQIRSMDNVEIYNIGLASAEREADLHVPFYRKWMFDGLASFDYDAAKGWLKNRLWRFDENKLRIESVKCVIKKLDGFKLKPYFIKIDVQGYELEVLKGGLETIKKYKPIILIESINTDHKAFLTPFQYHFYHFNNKKLVKGDGMLNTFCIANELPH
ncbi:MAG: FkbM family methyltransferase [Flavobacteriales bacterium]|nr:FkbM family methyltransferase [Flavobacteriales bacterium]